ncbi:hypothetical protein AC579_1073 [Pseudocercospora musae]|uniref:Uncharacterized protein n=1 Tax=Pseudocercospora musae TaxID=113226 RepID=A0A139H791_9PEZI|nr:hypothetical protein AC579_1073 [Pseudocercospora musae]
MAMLLKPAQHLLPDLAREKTETCGSPRQAFAGDALSGLVCLYDVETVPSQDDFSTGVIEQTVQIWAKGSNLTTIRTAALTLAEIVLSELPGSIRSLTTITPATSPSRRS